MRFRLLLLLSLIPSVASADSKQVLFEQANAAFFRGDYATAIHRYKTLMAAGVDDPDVAFNLATAYARQGRYGHAIRYFERTLRLRSGDEDALHGLATARTALGRRLAQAEGEAVVQTKPSFTEAVLGPVNESVLGASLLVLDVLLFGVLALLSVSRAESLRLGLGLVAVVCALLCAASGAALLAKIEAFVPGSPAVVVSDAVPVREGPDPRAQVRGELREGSRARILDHDGDYVLVQTPSKARGWVLAETVGRI